MLVLTAKGAKAEETWKRRLPQGERLRLGRKPEQGWSCEWDKQISREHVELVVRDHELEVRRIEGASNPVLFQGKDTPKFTLLAGQEFKIGQTTFQLMHVDAPDELVLGTYRITRPISNGPRGTVRLGTNASSGRTIVLKVLDDARTIHPAFSARFSKLAGRLPTLNNGNLISVYEASVRDGRLFIAEEHVPGHDLGKYLAKAGPRSVRQSVELIKPAVRALQYLHEQKLAHLNLKPTNVLVHTVGTVKLTDIGLSQPIVETPPEPREDGSTADPFADYLAPEQAANFATADIRSDIYSLGCLWYELLTGSPPFFEGGRAAKLKAHAEKHPPDPRKKADVTLEALATLYRMLSKSPADRFQTPAELLKILDKTTVAGMSVTCANCQKVYKIDAKSSGKVLKCKECGSPIRVPTVL